MASTIYRIASVQSETGLPRPTIYLRIKQGLFTKQINLGGVSVGWPQSEIVAINAARIAGKSDDEIRHLVKRLEAARLNAAGGRQ